jgi:hypothetical protein
MDKMEEMSLPERAPVPLEMVSCWSYSSLEASGVVHCRLPKTTYEVEMMNLLGVRVAALKTTTFGRK